MRSQIVLALSVAVAASALLCTEAAYARNPANNPATNFTYTPTSAQLRAAQREAARMVPASAVLAQEIDARKMHSGEQFRAKLTQTVYLKDGAALPKGTELIGAVVVDHMKPDGSSTLALRFTKADMKNGEMLPIVATIVGVAPPEDGTSWDSGGTPAAPDAWDGKALNFDQIGAVSGFNLHSTIAASNSGVFVSRKKDEVKLSDESQLALAIAGMVKGGRA